jgi:hypothetical protein
MKEKPEIHMAKDRKTKELADPTRLSSDADMRYLAENTDLSPRQARELVRRHGRDRAKLLEIARSMKAEG